MYVVERASHCSRIRIWHERLGLGMAFACAMVLSCALPPAAAGEFPVVAFLSAHPELFLIRSQAWGELGFDTAAHELHKTGEALRIGSQTYTNGLAHGTHAGEPARSGHPSAA